MNIQELSDEEKSVMLVRLARPLGDSCPAVYDDESDYEYLYDAGDCPCERENLYYESNMSLAWHVLNWARKQGKWIDEWVSTFADRVWLEVIDIEDKDELFDMPPGKAQRAWLDKILGLAIEAGMVEDEQ